MITAIHMRTTDLTSEWAAFLVEMIVSRIAGVIRVAVVRSMGIVSVMYDETKANAEQILRAVRAVGFDADIHDPGAAE